MAALLLAARSLSHVTDRPQARDTGLARTLSVALGLAAFFQTNCGPPSQLASLAVVLPYTPMRYSKISVD